MKRFLCLLALVLIVCGSTPTFSQGRRIMYQENGFTYLIYEDSLSVKSAAFVDSTDTFDETRDHIINAFFTFLKTSVFEGNIWSKPASGIANFIIETSDATNSTIWQMNQPGGSLISQSGTDASSDYFSAFFDRDGIVGNGVEISTGTAVYAGIIPGDFVLINPFTSIFPGRLTPDTLYLVNPVTEFSIDGTFAANSNLKIPTEAAILTYGNANWTGGGGGVGNADSLQHIYGLFYAVLNQVETVSRPWTFDSLLTLNGNLNFSGPDTISNSSGNITIDPDFDLLLTEDLIANKSTGFMIQSLFESILLKPFIDVVDIEGSINMTDGDTLKNSSGDMTLFPADELNIEGDINLTAGNTIKNTSGSITIDPVIDLDLDGSINFTGGDSIRTAADGLYLEAAEKIVIIGNLIIDTGDTIKHKGVGNLVIDAPGAGRVDIPGQLQLSGVGSGFYLPDGYGTLSTGVGNFTLEPNGDLILDPDGAFADDVIITADSTIITGSMDLTGDFSIDGNIIMDVSDTIKSTSGNLVLDPVVDVEIRGDIEMAGTGTIANTSGNLVLDPASGLDVDGSIRMTGGHTISNTSGAITIDPFNSFLNVDGGITLTATNIIQNSVGDLTINPQDELNIAGDVNFTSASPDIKNTSGDITIIPAGGDLIVNGVVKLVSDVQKGIAWFSGLYGDGQAAVNLNTSNAGETTLSLYDSLGLIGSGNVVGMTTDNGTLVAGLSKRTWISPILSSFDGFLISKDSLISEGEADIASMTYGLSGTIVFSNVSIVATYIVGLTSADLAFLSIKGPGTGSADDISVSGWCNNDSLFIDVENSHTGAAKLVTKNFNYFIIKK